MGKEGSTIKSPKHKVKIALTIPIVACVGFGIVALTGDSTGSAAGDRSPEPAVVATVEGKQISAKIYRMYLKNGVDALGLNARTDEGRRKIELLKEGIVSELIDRTLIEAEVKRRNLPVSDAALTEAYQKTVGQMGADAGYRAYLSEHGLTDEEFRETTALDVYAALLRRELDKEVSVSDADAQAFYDKERNNPQLTDLFKDPERVHARHILIEARRAQIARDIESTTSLTKAEIARRVAAEMAQRRNHAAEVLNKLRRGAKFERLAAEYSDDPATREHGGDLGLFARNTHTPRFDEAAFALKTGARSDIIETEYGYHIIEVTEHLPERARSFDDTRSAIRQRLLANNQAAHLKAWLEERRRQADIRIDPFYRIGELNAVGNNR